MTVRLLLPSDHLARSLNARTGSASAASSSNPNSNSNPTTIPSPPIPSQQPPTSHHVLARVAELRRVLPRPSPLGTGKHDLVHAHTIPHAHPEHFSPYARAHDCAVGSLYQHDVGALSSESLHSSVSRKSRKSHSTSSSCDGMAGQTFLDEPIEWHLPPNLARSTAKTDGLIPLPWSTDDANYHRSANIDAGHHSDDVGDAGVRTCPLDDGETTRCTAAACGGACLNCTLLSLPYFSPIDGLKDGAFEVLGSGANGHKEYEPVSVELGFELQFGSEAEGNSGGGPGSGVLDEQAIDEWLRGVGALPPASELSESPPPSDFGDALGANGLLGNFNFGDEDATFAAGGEQQEGVLLADANFPPEVQFGQLAWMFDLDVGGAPVYGLGDMCFLEAYTRSCSTSSGSASSALSVA
ncbi:hypothetical protein B0H17DRAFT_557980 [Mycena rosella]|uniref:Uncharacterized protein n=1 Tax=Mycena rosella TaxID=1033263 RepID=A0AAD7DH32_MYCRO|nr:hypothetical protein B0H17DRAFT_557980 [Mycena rosella]